jgi:hypothetical protein
MKIPVNAPCYACGERVTVFMILPDRDIAFQCSRGHDNAGPVDSQVGALFLQRAQYEFATIRDLSMTIIFAAMGFEAELSRLHHKWQRLAAWDKAIDIANEKLDELLRRHPNIKDKINTVAVLMHPPGIDDFVRGQDDLRQIVSEGYPSLSGQPMAEGLQRALFWPRNTILHMGRIASEHEEAVRALNVARLGVYVLDRMDEKKRNAPAP